MRGRVGEVGECVAELGEGGGDPGEGGGVGGGEIVGMLVIMIDGDTLLLDNFAVLPDWQNFGISKVLTTRANQEARRLGLGKLRLYTNARMTKNLELYRRRGWVEIERRTEHGFDRVYMERLLGHDEGW